jgi:hypothetical protein
MWKQNPYRKFTLHKPGANRRVGRPAVKWLDSVEDDLKKIGVRYCRLKSQDWNQWRKTVKEPKVHQRLPCLYNEEEEHIFS